MTSRFARTSSAVRLRPSLTLLVASTLVLAACDNSSGPRTGKLSVSVFGLPTGTAGQVTLTGPANYSHVVTANEVVANLKPGDYKLTSVSVLNGAARYTPLPDTQTVAITKSNTPVEASVQYLLSSGSLTVTVSGFLRAPRRAFG